ILLFYLLITKQFEKMAWPRVKRNIIMSFMMIVLGNGLTTFSEKYISSGLASLISTLSPLCVLVLNLSLGFEKPSLKIFIGILLGVGGIYLIYQNNLADFFNPDYRLGIAAILLAVVIWSAGTIYSKKISDHPGNMLVNLCFQMLFAGLFMLIAQFIIQPDVHFYQWSRSSIIAVIYLAIFGSLIGYAAYLYALSKLPSTKVSVFTYINAVVALVLGWLILNEKITLKIILAAILIIGGVIVANYRKAPPLPAKK
ncbi:MAG: EamA family transporter, partial [Daejeonella sp.]